MPDPAPPFDERASCKKCESEMLFIAATPCTVNPNMEKRTYFCFTCGQLKTFALQSRASPASPA